MRLVSRSTRLSRVVNCRASFNEIKFSLKQFNLLSRWREFTAPTKCCGVDMVSSLMNFYDVVNQLFLESRKLFVLINYSLSSLHTSFNFTPLFYRHRNLVKVSQKKRKLLIKIKNIKALIKRVDKFRLGEDLFERALGLEDGEVSVIRKVLLVNSFRDKL